MKKFTEMARQYPLTFEPIPTEDGGGFYAYSSAFPGMTGDGATRDEAAEDIIPVLADAIKRRVESGVELPKIESDVLEYSGKLNLRIGRSLHARVANRAKSDGISINALISQFVAYGLGKRESTSSVQSFAFLDANSKVIELMSRYKNNEQSAWKTQPKSATVAFHCEEMDEAVRK